MSSIWGRNIQVSVFGESHGSAIGCVIDGLPSGVELNGADIARQMARRSAASYDLATPRREKDEYEIVSGVFNSRTTGTPLCAIIRNKDTRSSDYTPELLRPGHADYTAYKRYNGYQDYRGGGHFSGRLTAPIVLAGAICEQAIHFAYPEVRIGSRILAVGEVVDCDISDWRTYGTLDLRDGVPTLTEEVYERMLGEIREAKENNDSVGGIIEIWVTGLEPGIGDPIFGGVESVLSSLLFSVPAVKGVEFGSGFELARMRGSESNDAFRLEDGRIVTETNNNGGINGGITNGMPLVMRCAVKPTSSISQTQNTVDIKNMREAKINLKGRHDPCIALRAHAVLEAVTAVGVLDLLMGSVKDYGRDK